MARRLYTNEEINEFIRKVIGEANHHGGNVVEVIMPLSTAVRSRLDLGRDVVSVYERKGKLARTCWVKINGRRYAFSYNYKLERIELRAQSTQGNQIGVFNNATSQSYIDEKVAEL